jgi:hypothetical protein
MSIPMSRAAMQGLKAQKEEELRIREEKVRLDRVKRIVDSIYNSAVQVAGTSTHSSFKYEIPTGRYSPHNKGNVSDPFYLNNMADILSGLQELFPGCSVTHSLMAKGRDGKLYDLTKMDDSVLPFIDQTLEQSYIVIDWS